MSNFIINNETNLLYPVKCDSYANLENAIDIWIKFTSYLKPEEILFLEKNKFFSQNELEKYLKIKQQLEISKLLLKYKNKNCNQKEYNYVLNFMKTSLKTFIQERMTQEEKEMSIKFIFELEKNNKLKEYVELYEKNYEKLSIYESYVLFNVKERLYYLEQEKLNEKIRNEQIKNDINLRKSLVKDFSYNKF